MLFVFALFCFGLVVVATCLIFVWFGLVVVAAWSVDEGHLYCGLQ